MLVWIEHNPFMKWSVFMKTESSDPFPLPRIISLHDVPPTQPRAPVQCVIATDDWLSAWSIHCATSCTATPRKCFRISMNLAWVVFVVLWSNCSRRIAEWLWCCYTRETKDPATMQDQDRAVKCVVVGDRWASDPLKYRISLSNFLICQILQGRVLGPGSCTFQSQACSNRVWVAAYGCIPGSLQESCCEGEICLSKSPSL